MLNRYKSSIVFVLLSSLFFTACKKDFIDNVHPTNSATRDQVFASASSVRTYFTGIYRQLRNQWQSIDQSAGGADDSWCYVSVYLARVAKGTDVTMPYGGYFYFDYQNDNREPTYRRVKFTWYYFYELINQLNNLIDGTTNSATISDDDKALLVAEARALRADLYFELIREFQFTYLKNPNAPGVPLYTEATSVDNLNGKPRGTVQQVYDQINSDLEFALSHLTPDRTMKDQVNLNVAEGFAARIYLEQGRWQDAYDAALAATDGYALDAAGYKTNYNGINSDEIIWSFTQTIGGGGQSLYYGTPSSFFEQSGDGYCVFWMSRELAETYSPTDVRFCTYQYDSDPSDADYYGVNKFGKDKNAEKIELLNGDEVPYKRLDFNESINMMRVGEMYLIMAEAKARLHEPEAATLLYELQSNRDPEAAPSGNTDQALIDEILLERRKELFGEIGVDWSDAKRLQLPIDRTHSNHASPDDYFLPANDPSFNLKIPQTEMQANKSLSAADQNP